jgi:transposase
MMSDCLWPRPCIYGSRSNPEAYSQTLDAMLITQEPTIACLQAEITALRETIAELREMLAKQEAIIRKFQAMLFGTKSEKGTPTTSPEQADEAVEGRELADTSPGTPATLCEQADETIEEPTTILSAPPQACPLAPSRPRGQRFGSPGHGRRLYEELTPHEVIHELPEDERHCSTCGKSYRDCGTEDSSEVEWEVAITQVIHRRKKYRRDCFCDAPVLITAPPPPKLIPKGLLAVSAIANLVVNKYLHGQPIHRQLHELQLHSGVSFAPGTIVGVLDHVGLLLRPVYDAILLHLREATHWHADETRWMQFADQTKQRWWLWVFAAPDAVAFVLDPTRSRAVPRRVFGLDDTSENAKRATGFVSCDRWKSYQGLPGLCTAFCWTHVRRDFTDLAKGYPHLLGAWTSAWVDRIGQLYALNTQRLHYEPGTEAFRQADAELRDHVEEIARVRDAERVDTSLIQEARKAVESMRRHWEGLTIFLDHPEVPLDNNEAERLLRLEVVGRKNFYGSSSLSSGRLVESAYSCLLTAVKYDLNPLTYLRVYLDACARNGGNTPADINRFLPWKADEEDLAKWKLPPHAI